MLQSLASSLNSSSSAASTQAAGGRGSLSAEEQRVVAELKATDSKVRAHEQAHMAAGAGLVGGASYSYQTGPDGKRYAVAGEVSINASPANKPEETINKAQRIRAAALAPADPSAQDYHVAASAARMAAEAHQQLTEQNKNKAQNSATHTSAESYRQSAQNPDAHSSLGNFLNLFA